MVGTSLVSPSLINATIGTSKKCPICLFLDIFIIPPLTKPDNNTQVPVVGGNNNGEVSHHVLVGDTNQSASNSTLPFPADRRTRRDFAI